MRKNPKQYNKNECAIVHNQTGKNKSEKQQNGEIKMKKFELFAGCLGNGITICNKAVMEYGDYKKVAHISNGGNIKLYVDADYIPDEDMKKIIFMADAQRKAFQEKFEMLPEIQQYEKILNASTISKTIEFIEDKRVLPEKLPDMKKYYYSVA